VLELSFSVADPHHHSDVEPDLARRFVADADPDTSFQIKAQNLEKELK
jgi:hypothetical protein